MNAHRLTARSGRAARGRRAARARARAPRRAPGRRGRRTRLHALAVRRGGAAARGALRRHGARLARARRVQEGHVLLGRRAPAQVPRRRRRPPVLARRADLVRFFILLCYVRARTDGSSGSRDTRGRCRRYSAWTCTSAGHRRQAEARCSPTVAAGHVQYRSQLPSGLTNGRLRSLTRRRRGGRAAQRCAPDETGADS
jgi:hypothetical protein